MNKGCFGYPVLNDALFAPGYGFPATKSPDATYGWLKNKDYFRGIPGLWFQGDPNYKMDLHYNGKVKTFYDSSGFGRNFAQINSSISPTPIEDSNGLKYIQFTSDNGLTFDDRAKTRFLHDGTPHGVYIIYRPNASNENIRAPLLWSTDSATITGYLLSWDDRSSVTREDRMTKIISRTGAAFINNVGVDGIVEVGSKALIRDVYFGNAVPGNDSQIFRNNEESSLSSAESSGSPSVDTDAKNIITIGSRNHSGFGFAYFDIWLMLIYNWKNHNASQIADFDKRITKILYREFSQVLTG